MPYREIVYRDFAMSDAIVHGTRETPIPDSPMKKINGPGMTLTQRLQLSQDIAYREIRVFVVECFCHFKIPIHETPIRS
jgi:hypothetical protein